MTYLWLRICNFIQSELIWSSKRVKSAENVDSWITGIPSLILVRHLRRNDLRGHQFGISRKGNTCYTRVRLTFQYAKKIINQKAHLLNNYFLTHIVLLVIHDTMQYFKTNDMYLRRFLSVYDLDVSNPIVVPVSLRLRLWRVIQNAHSRYALNQYCNVFFCENVHPILIIILVISVGVNLCISV